jgi:hypothetical protein
LRRLASAFVALLMQRLNQPLLPIPGSMHDFKTLQTTASTAGNFLHAHVAYVASWLQANTEADPGRAVLTTCVIDKFVATNIDIVQAMHKYYNSKQVAAVEKPLELAGQMIDACLAKLGIAADEDGLYLGLGLQAAKPIVTTA